METSASLFSKIVPNIKMYHSHKKKSPLSPLKNYLTLKASSQYSSFFVKIFREVYFRLSSLCSVHTIILALYNRGLLRLVTQSNGQRPRQKKKRTEARSKHNETKVVFSTGSFFIGGRLSSNSGRSGFRFITHWEELEQKSAMRFLFLK